VAAARFGNTVIAFVYTTEVTAALMMTPRFRNAAV
jgi:hypothetical protein